MNQDEFDFLEETSYSTRNQTGVIKYFNTFEEALQDFLDYEGYRLDVTLDNCYFFLYRDELPELPEAEEGSLRFEDPTSTISYVSKIMIRKF